MVGIMEGLQKTQGVRPIWMVVVQACFPTPLYYQVLVAIISEIIRPNLMLFVES